MMVSMTGYGRAEGIFEEKKITIELRSLNSKQTDINARMPGFYKEKEIEIRKQLTTTLRRGKIDFSIYVESSAEDKNFKINTDLLKSYYQDIQSIIPEIKGAEQSDILASLLKMPDIFKTERQELSKEEWLYVSEQIKVAVANIQEFRAEEGKALAADLMQRVTFIRESLEKIIGFEQERIDGIRARITNNIEEFVEKSTIDQNRLEQEIIYYLEKIDITEEKVRLVNHCNYFEQVANETESNGKKLGFITQEMGREINTIGSKANHAAIQRHVVEMKDELEKIKEQVLNVL